MPCQLVGVVQLEMEDGYQGKKKQAGAYGFCD